jgi:hypothetical protein
LNRYFPFSIMHFAWTYVCKEFNVNFI